MMNVSMFFMGIKINPRDILVNGPNLQVDPNLDTYIGLSSCLVDSRPLKVIYTIIGESHADIDIADSLGGFSNLRASCATVGQLAKEIQLAMNGEKGLFKKGESYLPHFLDKDKNVLPVLVCWCNIENRWTISCFDSAQNVRWNVGLLVCGNEVARPSQI